MVVVARVIGIAMSKRWVLMFWFVYWSLRDDFSIVLTSADLAENNAMIVSSICEDIAEQNARNV